jgi:hypothetical protein
MTNRIALCFAALVLTACSKPAGTAADTAASTVTKGGNADPDRNVSGGSIPAGYTARTDRAGVAISGAKYVQSGDGWDVTTGPAHILFAPKDSATVNYTASATFEQLEAPAHPEAFGIFIGGIHLELPSQAYVYFVVRGTGEMLVRLRDGASTRDTIPWTANAAIPKQDASGKATYNLAASVKPDSVRFMVNGKQVAALGNSNLQSAGIAGIRINHNLHLKVTPISIKPQ